MKFKNIITLFLLLSFSGCDNSTDTPKQSACESCKDCGPSEPSQTSPTLNDGKKWKVDAHTNKIFTNIQNIISKNKKPLAKNIQNEIQSLIKGCTMKGEAHNQLHNYLMKLIPAVDDLSKNNNEKNLSSVKDIMSIYPKVFE
jgi:hypothetical protein